MNCVWTNRRWSGSMIKLYPASTQIAKYMGPTCVLSAPDGPHVGPMNLAIRETTVCNYLSMPESLVLCVAKEGIWSYFPAPANSSGNSREMDSVEMFMWRNFEGWIVMARFVFPEMIRTNIYIHMLHVCLVCNYVVIVGHTFITGFRAEVIQMLMQMRGLWLILDNKFPFYECNVKMM